MIHELVVVVLVAELHDGSWMLIVHRACCALVPAVECSKRQNTVNNHEQSAYRGDDVTPVPRDFVNKLQSKWSCELHPQKPEDAPYAHEHEVGSAIDVEERTGVVPGDNAECYFHKPTDKVLECAPDDSTNQEDQNRTLLVEPVERNRHEHGAHAINGTERAIQQASAVLVDTWFHDYHVPSNLDKKAGDAGNHEDPEEVEEVQLDISFARSITAQCAVFSLRSPFKFMQASLQLAFLAQRRVRVRLQCDQNDHVDAWGDELARQAS